MGKIKIDTKEQSIGIRVVLASIAALLFRGTLDIFYVNYIVRIYAGEFPLNDNGVVRLLESYIIALFLVICIASSLYRRWRASGIVIVLYYIVVIVPLTSQYGLADAPALLLYASSGGIIMVTMVTELFPKLKVLNLDRTFTYLGVFILFGLCACVYGWLIYTGGFGRLNLNLLKVYEVRTEYVRNIQSRGPFMGYLIPWQAYVFNMFGLLYALKWKNYWLLSLVIIAQLLIFAMTGHKSFLLAPFLVSGVYIVWKSKSAITWIIIGAFILIITSYIYFLITKDEFVPSLFIRRLFFVPARLHVLYYDFFSQPEHPFYMLSDSVLRFMVKNPYNMPMVRVIALEYWGREFWPDVGYLGDAYGNFGIIGVFLFSMILGIILWVVDSVGSHLPSYFVAALFAMPAMALTESALFTTMLTHGLIPAVLILWISRTMLINKDNKQKYLLTAASPK